MHRGYIKLWRKSLESTIWDNPKLWRFWVWCLLKANHCAMTQIVGFQDVQLTPGQFIFGRLKASMETGLSEQEIRTAIDGLRKRQNLTIKSTNKFSIITIVNWTEYQEEPTNKAADQQPTVNQQLTTNKNDKNVKNKKEIYKERFKSYELGLSLTEKEWNDLVKQFGSAEEVERRVQNVIDYSKSKGRPYKDLAATIRSWDQKERRDHPERFQMKGPRLEKL